MQAEEATIEGAWIFTPVLRPDERGVFLESFEESVFVERVGHSFPLKQMNVSISKRGTIRGVHFADVPPGQAKYVQCFTGRILDIVVDIRVGSPTFGKWDAIELDDKNRRGLYIAEGLGHAFCALTESVTVGYLCSQPYAPDRERGINPLDSQLQLPWPDRSAHVLSPKDSAAPTLGEAMEQDLLPDYSECKRMQKRLRSR